MTIGTVRRQFNHRTQREAIGPAARNHFVGQPLPATVTLHTVPKYKQYSYAVVNNKRVIVEPQSRKVVKIIE